MALFVWEAVVNSYGGYVCLKALALVTRMGVNRDFLGNAHRTRQERVGTTVGGLYWKNGLIVMWPIVST